MTKREFLFYLEDMVSSMEKIAKYLQGIEFNDFAQNDMIIDAVIRNFEIIGEAANNIPNEIQEKYPDIPWSKMYRLRNIAIHHYHGIDYEMIWEISHNHLPQNKIDIQKLIDYETNTNH